MAFALLFDDIDPQLHGPDVDERGAFVLAQAPQGDFEVVFPHDGASCLLVGKIAPEDVGPEEPEHIPPIQQLRESSSVALRVLEKEFVEIALDHL